MSFIYRQSSTVDDEVYSLRLQRDQDDREAMLEVRDRLARGRRHSSEANPNDPDVSFLRRLRAHTEDKQRLLVLRDSRRGIETPVQFIGDAPPTLPTRGVSRPIASSVSARHMPQESLSSLNQPTRNSSSRKDSSSDANDHDDDDDDVYSTVERVVGMPSLCAVPNGSHSPSAASPFLVTQPESAGPVPYASSPIVPLSPQDVGDDANSQSTSKTDGFRQPVPVGTECVVALCLSTAVTLVAAVLAAVVVVAVPVLLFCCWFGLVCCVYDDQLFTSHARSMLQMFTKRCAC